MTTRRFAYTRPDGGVSVVIPAPKYMVQFATEAEALAAIRAKDIPADAADVIECDAAEIPADRTFREAWRRGLGAPVGVDITKARVIHMDRIRAARDRELARLDIEQLKGTDVAAEKQALRDLPQTFDLMIAATPDALKALWPADLPRS